MTLEYCRDEDTDMRGWQLPYSALSLRPDGFYVRVSRAGGGSEPNLRVDKAGRRLKGIMKAGMDQGGLERTRATCTTAFQGWNLCCAAEIRWGKGGHF